MDKSDVTKVTIAAGDPADPAVVALLRRSEEELHALYGGTCRTLSVEQLALPAVRFLVARVHDEVVGCGALLLLEKYAEVKRMFVTPTARCRGVGAEILSALERAGRVEGVQTLRLQTGEKQPAAVALYRGFGYVDRAIFGEYDDNPLSIYMEKRLVVDKGASVPG